MFFQNFLDFLVYFALITTIPIPSYTHPEKNCRRAKVGLGTRTRSCFVHLEQTVWRLGQNMKMIKELYYPFLGSRVIYAGRVFNDFMIRCRSAQCPP